jgi:hypothetical protein
LAAGPLLGILTDLADIRIDTRVVIFPQELGRNAFLRRR